MLRGLARSSAAIGALSAVLGGGAVALSGDALPAAATIAAAAAVAAALGALAGRRVSAGAGAAVARLRQTIARLAAGDLDARARWRGDDELAELAAAFDELLDDRASALNRVARESQSLNDSVIEIMQAVGRIASSKDLTVKVPVTEDVTGAVADALNLLTEETGRVLGNVADVSQEVARAAAVVQGQSETASGAAERERREVGLAAAELERAARALATVAERARAIDGVARRAVEATGTAVGAVSRTVDAIVRSREVVRDAGKRIKRLGERSQEIGQAVALIESIAERTGILALNASMHAAASGESGRAFAGVADEVRRLSESAREATSQIARLVSAIQSETADAVTAMGRAVSEAVEVGRLAEEAGGGMLRTQKETEALAADVRDIAGMSTEQARAGAALQERARVIIEASEETARQLVAQADETRRLVECSKALLEEVGVFRIPERE